MEAKDSRILIIFGVIRGQMNAVTAIDATWLQAAVLCDAIKPVSLTATGGVTAEAREEYEEEYKETYD
jgi:hypothetical protein